MNVVLSSFFSSIAPGNAAGPDSSVGYVNLAKRAIWVHDIVFDWDWTVPARTQSKTYGTALGEAIRARITYANQPVTNGYIPIPLLARTRNWRATASPILASGQTVTNPYIWKFPAPLWIPPNGSLDIRILHQNDFAVDIASAAQTVRATVRGTLDDVGIVPQFIDIPYVSAFLGAVQSTVSGGKTGLAPAVTERSGQTDLYNPFDVPLSVERLSYEIAVSSHGYDVANAKNANFAPTDATSAQDQTSRLNAGQNYGLDRRYVSLKLVSSLGRSVIKDFLPIGCVLSSNTRSLEARSTLNPTHYYAAMLSEQMPLFTDRGTLPFQMRVGLSMVGTRRLTPEEVFRGTYA